MDKIREAIFCILDAIILLILGYRLILCIVKNISKGMMSNDEVYYGFIKPLVKPTIAWAVLEQVMVYYGYEDDISMMVLTSLAAIVIMLNAAQLEIIMRNKNRKTKKTENEKET